MTIILLVSTLGGIPTILKMREKRATHFEGIMLSMCFLTSLMYHFCEIYSCNIFLDELQWHRLDNIFAITSFGLVLLHTCGVIVDDDDKLKWVVFLISMVIQEKEPFNAIYTVIPCIFFTVLGLILRFYHRNTRKVTYNMRNMLIALSFIGFGVFFFLLGLDDANDYLRGYHSMWHICAAIFGYFCLTSVHVVDIAAKIKQEESETGL